MSISAKRLLMLLILAASSVWNLLCAANILPLRRYTASVTVVGFCALGIVLVPLFFPACAPDTTRSAYIGDLTRAERRMAGATICLAIFWILTAAYCFALKNF